MNNETGRVYIGGGTAMLNHRLPRRMHPKRGVGGDLTEYPETDSGGSKGE